MKLRRTLLTAFAAAALMAPVAGAYAQSISDLEAAARKEGNVVSLGMPDDWANWGEIWKAITAKYGVTHTDTDMSSGEALAKIEAEKANPSADITEIGLEFAPVAIAKGLLQPYKTTNWDKIPDWAKDKDGQWALSYTGTIAFAISKDVKNPPKSWADLLTGDYKVSIGEVGKASQSNVAVLATNYALGGDESNLQPPSTSTPSSRSKSACCRSTCSPRTWRRARSRSRSSGTSTRSPIGTSPARRSGTS